MSVNLFILFPQHPVSARKVDPELGDEAGAARAAGFDAAVFDHEALIHGDPAGALAQFVPPSGISRCLLRGWMMPGEAYAALHRGLLERGIELLTPPDAYEEAHYLPLSYRHIEGQAPRSAWITGDNPDAAWELYAGFAGADAIIKDWVKSAKHRWKTACFIPAGTDEPRFREIFRAFREARGSLFNRGVVLREFLPLIEHGEDVRGLPRTAETRLFFGRGELIVEPDATPPSALDERDRWESVARRFQSPFLAIDVARLRDGSWRILEVGDGGVSGLPGGLDPEAFYRSLRTRFA